MTLLLEIGSHLNHQFDDLFSKNEPLDLSANFLDHNENVGAVSLPIQRKLSIYIRLCH